jgi:hypothetical protein
MSSRLSVRGGWPQALKTLALIRGGFRLVTFAYVVGLEIKV